MALTDTRLRNLKPKGRVECLVADGNGLYIRIRAKQSDVSRTWQFRRKERGELTVTTLGTYPELSIREARLKAAELATKRQSHSPTVQEVAEQWLAERIDHTHRKADQVRGYVDRAIIPELGHRTSHHRCARKMRRRPKNTSARRQPKKASASAT